MGEVIAGVASVDESAITGESAPVLKLAQCQFRHGTRGSLMNLLYGITSQPEVYRPNDCPGGSGALQNAE